MAKALNRMRERITGLIDDRTKMLAAISHDLRTPITRMRLRSEFIEDETHRGRMLGDLDQMRSMLESVLSFLRNDRRWKSMTLVDIASTLQLVTDQFADMGHKVGYVGPGHAMATVRPDDLHRSVTNLVENAVRFGAEAVIRLGVSADIVTIDVEDDGPGISDTRKDDCWSRSCAATTPATWTRPRASGSAFPSRTPSCSRMAERCRCTTGSRTGWWRGFSCRCISRRRNRRREDLRGSRSASGRYRVFRLVVNRDRLEAIIAGAAGPEIGYAARRALDPVGHRNRLAALSAGFPRGK